MRRNPFDDDALEGTGPVNPFGEEREEVPDTDPAGTIEHASARIRRLRSLVGAEGLTLSGTRELLDQVTKALDAVARALRER